MEKQIEPETDLEKTGWRQRAQAAHRGAKVRQEIMSRYHWEGGGMVRTIMPFSFDDFRGSSPPSGDQTKHTFLVSSS